MGGWGSGAYFRNGGKSKAESSLPFDIRVLHKQGLLVPGRSFTSKWSVGRNSYHSSVSGVVHGDHLVLKYRHRGAEDIEQRVDFTWTDCNYGGQRVWFSCPDCGRRCAVIYSRGKYFSCRVCCNLSYNSQCQTVMDRCFDKANNLREKIGAEVGSSHRLPLFKPKYMHQKTWDKIRWEIERLEHRGWAEMGQKMGVR